MQQKQRLDWIDFAKGLAIILVVYRHIMIGLTREGLDVHQAYIIANEVVYTFRMPLFFILTGIFITRSMKKRDNKSFIISKVKTLIYPYLIWAVLQVSVQLIISNYTNSNRGFVDYLYIIYHPRAIDQFWFLFALFNNCLLFLAVSKVTRGNKYLMFLVAVIFHYLASLIPQLDLLKDALYYFIFLVIGDIISPYLFEKKYQNSLKSPLLTVGLLPFFVTGQMLWFSYPDMNLFLFAIIEVVGCFLMLNVSFQLASVKIFDFINVAGRYSLQIYVMHVIISGAVRIVLINFFGIETVPVLMTFGVFLGCVLPVAFSRYGKKYGTWAFFTPDNPFKRPRTIAAAQPKPA